MTGRGGLMRDCLGHYVVLVGFCRKGSETNAFLAEMTFGLCGKVFK